jgi:hypothetical protein
MGVPDGNIRQWFGDAVGQREGDTLVVDTTNRVDKTNYEWGKIIAANQTSYFGRPVNP